MITVTPLAGACGAEVEGVRLDSSLTEDEFARIEAAFVEHQVLVFREQNWSEDEQMAFGRRFGELDTHPFVDGQPDRPEVLDIVTEAADRVNFGGGWHTDVTFLAEPDMASVLYGVEIPRTGGDTLFASQVAAYDSLSPLMQSIIDPLTAVHSAAKQYAPGGQSTYSNAMATKNSDMANTSVEHPVVRTHPVSGRKALYVNRAFTSHIKGLRRSESEALLEFLWKHAVLEPFSFRLRWQPGTVAMWDNRSVQHYALHDYAGQRRHVRRVTVKGDRPV